MSRPLELSIIQLNDSHGYLELHPELFWKGNKINHAMVGGYPRISSIVKEIRNDNPGKVMFFDGGDTIHGTYPAIKKEGFSLVPLLNELDFNAMTAHWEFAYGPKNFEKLVKKLHYPMLAINCYRKKNNKLLFPPYTILEVNHLRIGIVGIAATIVDKVMPAKFSEGIYFTLGNDELSHYVTQLKNEEKVDLIIVLSHLGFPQDMKLAQEINNIDIILSSHTHNRIYRPLLTNNTIVIQSGCHGSFLGRLDLELTVTGIKKFSHKLITVFEHIKPDPPMEEMVNQVMDPYREYLNTVVGQTSTSLNRNTVLESTTDNFLLQSILDAFPAEMAFSNGWRYGAPIPPGPVTMNDLWNIIPVNPLVVRVKLTGRELWTMMEENLERTFSRNPYNQMGGYVKRCMGINTYCKIENPYGYRIQEIFVQGKKLEPDKIYDAVYLTSQGVPSEYGREHSSTNKRAIEVLENYLERSKIIEAPLVGSIVAI